MVELFEHFLICPLCARPIGREEVKEGQVDADHTANCVKAWQYRSQPWLKMFAELQLSVAADPSLKKAKRKL